MTGPRGLAYAPYADLIWCETGKPDLAFAKALAEAILAVIQNPERRAMLIKNSLEYAHVNGWQVKKERYLRLVDSLLTETFDEFGLTRVAHQGAQTD